METPGLETALINLLISIKYLILKTLPCTGDELNTRTAWQIQLAGRTE